MTIDDEQELRSKLDSARRLAHSWIDTPFTSLDRSTMTTLGNELLRTIGERWIVESNPDRPPDPRDSYLRAERPVGVDELKSKPWPPSPFRVDPLPAEVSLLRPRGAPAAPDARIFYRGDLEYFRTICERTKLSTREIAKCIGINDGELRGYLSGRRPWPYTVQFAIERLEPPPPSSSGSERPEGT